MRGLLAGALCATVLLCLLPAPRPSIDPDPRALQLELQARRALLPEASPASQALARDIRSVHRKAVQTEALAENPGAFREALAAIKTTPEGRSYAANYKLVELAAAKQRAKQGTPLPWVERGPGNVSGRARAIVVDPGDLTRRTWFVATVGGGIWKTTDAGASWRNLTPELATLSTTCLAMCASQPNVMYAGTGMGYGRIVDLEGSGIWKSIDRGETWSQLASTASGQIYTAINRIVVDPNDPDVLVVCSNTQYSHLGTSGGSRISGIFRSIDGGQSWVQTFDADAVLGTSTDNRVQQIVADPTDFQKLYASVNEVGVIKSIDGGATWTVSADDFALPGDVGNPTGGWFGLAGISVRTELAIAPTRTQRLYAAVERPRGIGDIYMSDDAGATWSILTDTTGDPNWFNAFAASGASGYSAGWFDNTIVVSPTNENLVFVGGVNLYRVNVNPGALQRQTNPMAWWVPNGNLPVVHADHHWLETIDVGGGFFWLLNANDGGVALSQDAGQSWTQITGMGTTQFYGVDKAPGVDRYVGGTQDNGTWRSGVDPGSASNWTHVLGGDGFEVAWHATDAQLMLYASQFNGLARSTDGGNSWASVPEAAFPNNPFITKIANEKVDPDLVFLVGSTGVRRSDDFGLSWTDVVFNGPWLGHRPFDNVEISLADPQVVWASSSMGLDPATNSVGGVWMSTDGGLNFVEISDNFPGIVIESSGIGTHPTDAGTAYFCFSLPGRPKILRTTDFGQSFQDISGFDVLDQPSFTGFPNVAVFSVLVMPFDTDLIWAGTEVGLFVSEDGGGSWQYSDSGLPHVAIFQLRIVEEQVLVATQGRGIWTVDLPELVGHTPPVATLSPRIRELLMAPDGTLPIQLDLRSPYDSTAVYVNDAVFARFGANAEPSTESFVYPVLAAGAITARVTSYKDGRSFSSPERSGSVFPVASVNKYSNDFQDITRHVDFTSSGFQLARVAGFPDRAAQSQHPYPTDAELILQLRKAIRVDASDGSLRYRDVCLVEKGVDPNYGDPNFWDYVVVEGSSDGSTWLPLAPGYDSRADALWSSAYDANPDGQGGSTTVGTSSLFVQHELDLRDSFAPGELIFVRFRLFSDPGVVAWGWAIDDLEIQPGALGLGDDDPTPELPPALATQLFPPRPNPFNPQTTLRFELGARDRVELSVHDVAGRLVHTLVAGEWMDAGAHERTWTGIDSRGDAVASGVYVVRLRTGNRLVTRKIALVK